MEYRSVYAVVALISTMIIYAVTYYQNQPVALKLPQEILRPNFVVVNGPHDSPRAPAGEGRAMKRAVQSKPLTTFLLIMVPTMISSKSFHSREMIRNTWYKGLKDSKDVMLRFAMGTAGLDDTNVTDQLQLATENRTHGDLIYFDNFAESRTALTNKTLLMMQWAYSNVNFSYFLKCDDDTFVFVERMITELQKRPSATGLYYGWIQTRSKPSPNGVWADKTWKLGSFYLPFALGGGYILSSDLIKLIVGNIDYLEWHPNEDTAVGSWLAPYKVEVRKDKLICRSFKSASTSNFCQSNSIMHLFYGLEQSKLDEIFYRYAKLRSVK